MKSRTRTVLAATLILGIMAGPAAAAASAGPRTVSAEACAAGAPVPGPVAAQLQEALSGLPDADSTAALVRIGGTGGHWCGSAGVKDLRTGEPAVENGRFRAGSVTKVFTAAAVLQMAAEKKVALDRPARSYLPDLIPAAYGRVTVRQLLNHTSGIPAAPMPGSTVEEWYAHRFDRHDPRDMITSATGQPREFAPGTRQHYLNINYTVLGALIERISGRPYADEVGRRILKPLGLHDTYYPGAATGISGPHNTGYQVFPAADGTSELRDVTRWGQTETWAAGDIISSTADLQTFITALFGGKTVPAPQLEEMFTLPDPRVRDYESGGPAQYSAGLSATTLGGVRLWGKTGGRYGYSTAVGATRDLSRTFVYSINSTDAKGEDMNPTALALMVAAFGAPSA